MTGALSKNNLPHNTAENIRIGLLSFFTKSVVQADNIPNELDTEAFSIRQKYKRMPSSTNSASVSIKEIFYLTWFLGVEEFSLNSEQVRLLFH